MQNNLSSRFQSVRQFSLFDAYRDSDGWRVALAFVAIGENGSALLELGRANGTFYGDLLFFRSFKLWLAN